MLVLQLLAVAIQVSRDDGFSVGGVRPEFARQVAGVVRMMDRIVVPARRQLALEILNSGPTQIAISPTAPQASDSGPLLSISARNVAQRIVSEGVDAGRLSVSYVPNDAVGDGPLAQFFRRHLQIVVALRSGEYLVIDPDSDVNSFVFGTFASIAAALLGIAGLAIVVFAIYRQTRPLGALAGNVERFAQSVVPVSMKEEGAPEIRSLIRATNQMQQQIAVLLRNRALVLAGMSHDLRTQVTRLRLRLELLPAGEARDRAIADVEAMQALTEETLEFAKGDSEPGGGSTDAVALLGQIAAEREAVLPGAVSWASRAGPAVVVAIAETPLRRVVDNLVDNAIAYGRRADVSLAVAGRWARISVADRGPGIPVHERGEVFEPYYRLEPSRGRAGGGTGLGLAIVKQIVTRHRGDVTIEDRPGGGTVFVVKVPLA
jgi:signal transduction histidine kinase